MGTYAHLSPAIEERALRQARARARDGGTQVVARDRHAAYFAALALVAAGIERLATNVRHWQRSEVGEAEEAFTAGQKGSSAMPHKRNPILSENLCGLARVVRAAVVPALEDVALWHERDISHSSVERMIGPDATATLGFMLDRAASLVDGLVVYPENLKRNLDRAGELYFSEAVLLALVESRDAAAGGVRARAAQRDAGVAWGGDVPRAPRGDAEVTRESRPRRSRRSSISITRSRTCRRSWSGRSPPSRRQAFDPRATPSPRSVKSGSLSRSPRPACGAGGQGGGVARRERDRSLSGRSCLPDRPPQPRAPDELRDPPEVPHAQPALLPRVHGPHGHLANPHVSYGELPEEIVRVAVPRPEVVEVETRARGCARGRVAALRVVYRLADRERGEAPRRERRRACARGGITSAYVVVQKRFPFT